MTYDIDMPTDALLNRDGVFTPGWIPPNIRLTMLSNDPGNCIVARLMFKEAKPITIIMNDHVMVFPTWA